MMKRGCIFICLQICICWGLLWGASTGNNFQLSLAEVFGEGMVLQQEDINNIWGIGRPFAIVQVEFQNQKVKTEGKPDGRWMLSLKNLAAGGPYRLKVTSGNESVLLSEVYVGEVWLATGQSNMERKLFMSENGEAVVRSANNQNIHFLIVPQVYYKGHNVN